MNIKKCNEVKQLDSLFDSLSYFCCLFMLASSFYCFISFIVFMFGHDINNALIRLFCMALFLGIGGIIKSLIDINEKEIKINITNAPSI